MQDFVHQQFLFIFLLLLRFVMQAGRIHGAASTPEPSNPIPEPFTQRAQYPLIKEYGLKIIYGFIL